MKFNIDDLSLTEKLGQMLIVGIEGNNITNRVKKLILEYKVGGIILYKKNFNSVDEMISLIKKLKELNKANKIPLFIAIDQEGGRVNRMPKELLNLPSANLIAHKLGTKGVHDSSRITAEILSKSGFNMNFAPVIDINRFMGNKVIGDRSFGEDADTVSKLGAIQMDEFRNKNIVSVIKHFPGHGATTKDSHFILPRIDMNIKTLEKEDMKPFERLINQGADGVLVGHLKIKGVTSGKPCSLSRKFIIKYLRKKYHYRGLIISDDLKMRAIKNWYGYKKAVIDAIHAGNDIVIFRYNQKQEEKTILNLMDKVKSGKLNNYRINQSVKRILTVIQI